MANANAKRRATQNEAAIKTLRLGMIVPSVLSLLLRFIFRRNSLPPSKGSLAIYTLTLLPAIFLSRYLEKIGTIRRDPTTGTLISSGEDLSQPGVTEWCFDVLYVTWICQVGSGLLGEWVWWLYLAIPLYAGFKLWTSVISPMFLGRASSTGTADDPSQKEPGVSKRQEKLRKRSERGDPRVQTQSRKI